MCTCPHRFDFSYVLDFSGLTHLLCLFVSGLCQRQWGLMCWRSYLRVPQMEEPRRCLQLFEIRWVFLYDSYEFFTLSACLRLVALLDWLWPASQIEEFPLGSFWLAYGTRLWELKCNSWACGIQGHFSEQHIQLYGFLLQCAMRKVNQCNVDKEVFLLFRF
jgi:hypothetical protein